LRIDVRRRTRMATRAALSRRHESGSLEDLVDGAARGPHCAGLTALELGEDLLAAPSWVGLSNAQDRSLDLGARLIWMRVRCARLVVEAVCSQVFDAMEDL
jgi:hypothetical protein